MVGNLKTLPENYREKCRIELQKDKKTAALVNLLALVIAAVMIIPVIVSGSLTKFLDSIEDGAKMYFIKIAVMLAGMVAYFILHELTHGVFMLAFSGVKPKFGFTGLYAYAGSSAFFNKKCYIIISMAPVVILGAVLAVMQIFIGDGWSFIVYVVQIINISGAAGDYYVTVRMLKMDSDILVNDTGVSMTFYEKEK